MSARGGKRSPRRLFELPVSEDVKREVRFHIDMKVEELRALGWTEESARQEAERLFGDPEAVELECREITERQRRTTRRLLRWDALSQDVRFGARVLLRRPGFLAMAVLTLALGIGANSAVFSVIDALVLRPLPYEEPDRLVSVWEQGESGRPNRVAEPNYLDWRERSRTLHLAAYRGPWLTPVLGGAEPVRAAVAIVTEDFFQIMRGRARVGRLPGADEIRSGAPGAVVSESFWRSVLRGQADLGGILLTISDQTLPVVAVMPSVFEFPGKADIWVAAPPDAGGDRTSHNYEVVARLRDGASVEASQNEMRRIGEDLATRYAGEIDALSVGVTPLADVLYGSYRRPLLLLFGAAAIVLLVACTNLASSLLARSKAREREMAVRASVGANRHRLIRQLLTESLMLAGLGGVAGLALAWGALAALRSFAAPRVLELREIQMDPSVLIFTLIASIIAAVLFGLMPALRAREYGVATLLRSGDRADSGRRSKLWNTLVAVEVALAMVLLVSCGLLLRSFIELLSADPGFETRDVIAVDVFVPAAVHPTDTAVAQIQNRLIEELARIRGVQVAGIANELPGPYGLNGGVDLEGREPAYAEYRVASEGFFEALRIPLKRGRLFDDSDQIHTLPVVLVNEAFAQQFYAGTDPIGARLRNLRNDAWYYGAEPWLTIVGVVGNVRPLGTGRDAEPTVYVMHRQRSLRARDGVIALRTNGSNVQIQSEIREVMGRVAPNVPFEIISADERVAEPIADRRFALMVVGGFAVIALVLAAVGIHGVVSYSVERRTREMGIRIALGAVPAGVARRIVQDAMLVVLVGVGIGLIGSIAAVQLLRGTLGGTGAVEPGTFTLVTLLLVAVALLASALPSLRVTRIDPILALRAE